MKSNIKIFSKKVITLLVSLLMIFSLFSAMATSGVSAEEISAEAQAVIDLAAKIPTNPETATLDDKDNVIAAKLAFDALTNEQKGEVPPETLSLITANTTVLMPQILTEIVTKIKALPKTDKLTSSDKENVLDIYKMYSVLDDTARSACSKDYRVALFSAVNKLSPDTITEEEKAFVDEYNKKLEEQKAKEAAAEKAKKDRVYTVWQYSLMALALLVVLFSVVIMIILIIKIAKV